MYQSQANFIWPDSTFNANQDFTFSLDLEIFILHFRTYTKENHTNICLRPKNNLKSGLRLAPRPEISLFPLLTYVYSLWVWEGFCMRSDQINFCRLFACIASRWVISSHNSCLCVLIMCMYICRLTIFVIRERYRFQDEYGRFIYQLWVMIDGNMSEFLLIDFLIIITWQVVYLLLVHWHVNETDFSIFLKKESTYRILT
jgi:hypothetical protein